MDHTPSNDEIGFIDKIQAAHGHEFVTLRITKTMLVKSTIDANRYISQFFKNAGIFNFEEAEDGEKYYIDCVIFEKSGFKNCKSSCYRPKAKPQKPGDPRFWPSKFNHNIKSGDLAYICAVNCKLVVIPIKAEIDYDKLLPEFFKGESDLADHQISAIESFLKNIALDWIPSVSLKKKNDKDVGETFEKLMGLKSNNSQKADLSGELELKTKRLRSKTDDTLFCKVPDPDKTPLKKAKSIILKYGYPSNDDRRPLCNDLFVTVSNKPNPQGLFHEVDRKASELRQYRNLYGHNELVAVWSFQVLKDILLSKHPATAWIGANEKKIDGEIHFNYCHLEISRSPIFEKFLIGLETGKIVFDWRGSYPLPGATSSPIDKGHAFRLKGNVPRSFLFGESKVVAITPVTT